MKFNTNKLEGVKVSPIFENENYDSKLLEYTKSKELFIGKFNEIYVNLPYNGEKEILIGLGKRNELEEDQVREVFFKLVKVLAKHKEFEAEITINLATEEKIDNIEDIVNEAFDIISGIFFARDLVNERAEYLYPETLANIASEELSALGVEVEVYDEKQCEELGLKGLLAVGRGSDRKPRFIVMKYLNNPEESEVIGLVGKGVTYDSGGYSIKPTANSMDIMHCDMGGAGTVIGTMKLVATRKLKTNVIAVVGACENMIAGGSYKPGDVISTLSGKTVEVLNTDAEGRITLADSVYYATEKLKVSKVIDLATLTGACLVALAEFYTGAVTNNQEFYNELSKAAKDAGERVWQLPADDSFRELNKSTIADVKNTGGRLGGTITAGLFIENFVANNVPWIHLDIAGTAYLSKGEKYLPKGATGVHVKTLYNLLNK